MNSTNDTLTDVTNPTHTGTGSDPSPGSAPMPGGSQRAGTPLDLSDVRTTAREFANPVDYRHPYESMAPRKRLRLTRLRCIMTPIALGMPITVRCV